MNEPQPVNIKILRNSIKYPNLKKDLVCTVPKRIADELLQDDDAEIADGLEVVRAVYGENTFEKIEKKKKKEQDEPKKTSLFIDDKHMYEQIKKNTGVAFLRYDFESGMIDEVSVIDGAEPLFPIDDEEVVNGHIKLSSGIEEYGTEEQLITDIENHVKKYLDVPEDYLRYAVLNIVKSWVYERYRSLNYLRVQGEPGTGKSRFLDVIGGLHYKPIATSGASTVAPIFRLINKWGCTLIMDEADIRQSDETNDLIKIINQGFEKDRPVIRCNPDNKSQVEFFDVYCPKVLSTRHHFEDVATESRCMTQIMTGTARSDIVSSLNEEFYNEQQILRNKLLLWRFRNFKSIKPSVGEKLDWTGIEPRLKQTNVGFVSLIYNDAEYLAKFMERIRKQQESIINERSETVEGHIVSAISRLMLEDRHITAKAIIDYAELTDNKGNKWKPRKIATYMKTLGFLGTRLQRTGETVEKAYEYNPQVLLSLIKKFLTKDELEHFDNEVRTKALALKSENFKPFFCNYVTVVTIAYEQGKTVTNTGLGQFVTNVGSHHKDGYIGYTVTKHNDVVENPTEAQKVAGEVFETQPGVWRKVV